MQMTTTAVVPECTETNQQEFGTMAIDSTPPRLQAADIEDRRRTLRLRKSSLVQLKMEGIEKPSLKIAENLDEYQQAFKLAYESYIAQGYVEEHPDFPYHFTPFSILPDTCLFIFKSYLTVIASLTEIFDTPALGLPIDALYKKELDTLRAQDRKIAELSSFVTGKKFRMRNIMVYLCKLMILYSHMNHVNDICIMVNPKHVQFYTRMFLFEPFGKEKFYKEVNAPAVALRLNVDNIEERLHEKYSQYEFTEDLYRFFYRTNSTLDMLVSGTIRPSKHQTADTIIDFFRTKTR